MTDTEWDATRDYLFGSFPGLAAYFGKIPEKLHETTRWQWRRVLGRYTPETIRQAIDAMVDGTVERPIGYERYPEVIAAAARRQRQGIARPVYVDGNKAVECPDCEDTGGLVVLTQAAVAEIKQAGREGRAVECRKLGTVAVRCRCERGSWRAKSHPTAYDPGRHFHVRGPEWDADVQAAAVAWAHGRAADMPNFEKDF